MDIFKLYLHLGIDHILNLEAYDHILFIVSLTAVYLLKQWRQILILVTAFTIGHSTTLVLSTLNIINVNPDLVEFLIPITIIITAFIAAEVYGLSFGMLLIQYLQNLSC